MLWNFINGKSKLCGNNSTRVAKGEKKIKLQCSFTLVEVA